MHLFKARIGLTAKDIVQRCLRRRTDALSELCRIDPLSSHFLMDALEKYFLEL
jgi:hypothetical protein